MITKTLSARLKPHDFDRLRSLIDKDKDSNSAVMKYLLDRMLNGSLTPTAIEPPPKMKTSMQVLLPVDENYKAGIDAKLGETGLKTTGLIVQLLNAYEEEQNQGEAK